MKKAALIAFLLIIVALASFSLYYLILQPRGGEERRPGRNRIAVIETNMGTMEVILFEDKAPITTKNFIDLAEKDFYNGIIFHRVIKGFIIQAGDPTYVRREGVDYTIPDEFHPDLKHDSMGILSMANAGPNTGNTQFFITMGPTPHLDGHHSVFGKLIKGEDVLETINSVETDEDDRPIEDVVIIRITIKES